MWSWIYQNINALVINVLILTFKFISNINKTSKVFS